MVKKSSCQQRAQLYLYVVSVMRGQSVVLLSLNLGGIKLNIQSR